MSIENYKEKRIALEARLSRLEGIVLGPGARAVRGYETAHNRDRSFGAAHYLDRPTPPRDMHEGPYGYGSQDR